MHAQANVALNACVLVDFTFFERFIVFNGIDGTVGLADFTADAF
jgi:hypothetical protein